MRLFEISSTTTIDPLLIEFWQLKNPSMLKYYFTQNNCQSASIDFVNFLESKGIMTAEVVKVGWNRNGQKIDGWFKADIPDLHKDALTKTDITAMREQGLNPTSKDDRKAYIYSSPELLEDFKMIPHSWVEYKGKILDPSGFYIDGKSGQFDRWVTDKTNLSARYQIF
jgi:hypothetical protein